MDVYFSGSFHRYILFSPAERLASALTILFFMPSSRSGLSMKCLMKSFSASRKAERGLKPAILTKGLYRSLVSWAVVPPKSSVMTLLRNLTVSLFKSENSMTLRIESDRDSERINLANEKECNHLISQSLRDERIDMISLILYFCSCFWTSESSLLRRLFRPLNLCVSLLLLLKRKVFTSSFF